MTINQTIYGVSRELIEHAIEALTRHLDQHAPMQVPPSKADSDLVREELRALLDAESAPCAKSQVEGKRERFQKWVMATKHPVFGFLDGRSLARGDDRTGYADEYVQGLWFACLEFGAEQPEPVSVLQTCKIGIYGKAFDAPETKRAYTYVDQPDNVAASKLGAAARSCSPGGDGIDHGLSLLKSLSDQGFGVFEIASLNTEPL
ncbi:hypothetical protein [Pseudomonas sp. 35 E 8]|uniref:hypothetical protein n=1 Tax=Pseudomonas sp. 35 E 8 TaxID=1844103 RepID=UPI000811D522|nr:hypothetical protein [Pseudomonas sp. 35 E 8]CRM61183.1 hypothetical protein [Pseudomonas sp. 35 E 8]